MKKFVGAFSAFLVFLIFLPGPAKAQSRFGFKAYGGLNYFDGGDLNKGAQGFGNLWYDMLKDAGFKPDGEFAPVHLGMNFGGEFIFQFTPTMSVGLGVGYISATKSSTIEHTPSIPYLELFWKSKLSAIPITATFYYFLPSTSNMKFFFNVGLGYYLAKVDFEHGGWLIVPINWDAKTSGNGLGFHGGLGLEYGFTPQFGLVVEVKGRYAAWNNFEGSEDWSYPPGGSVITLNGPLWATEEDNYGYGTETLLWVVGFEPSGEVRKAKVDFSGFSFTVGVIVHF